MGDRSILRDVAQTAGVSMRTASRVLNDDPNVAHSTRLRVQEVMRTLHYTPDAMARSLRAGTDATLGLIVESVADPFFSELVASVELAASHSARSVLIGSTHRDSGRERDLIATMVQRRVCGLLIAPTSGDHSWLQSIAATTPTVLIDRPAPGVHADFVGIDDQAAIALGVEHLSAQGHQKIAYIGDQPHAEPSQSRLAGYRSTMAALGLATPAALIRADCASPAAATAATRDLLADQDLTAIISATTRCSLGVVPALHARRRTDVALVSFGDFAMADTLEPGITVIDHPADEIGRVAVEHLTTRLAQPDLPARSTHVRVRVIERGSGEMPA